MKVLFLTNIPSPYLIEFFNLLGKEVDLTVIFERKRATDRHDSWNHLKFDHFKAVFPFSIPIGVENALCPTIGFYLKKKYDIVIIGTFSSPTGILAVMQMKFIKRNYFLFSEGGIAKTGKSIKEWLKHKVIKNAPYYLSACQFGDEYFVHYGANPKNIYRIPFTTLYQKDIQNEEDIHLKKKLLRKKFNIDLKTMVIVAVGRYIPLKSFETLIEVSSRIKHPHQTYIIGDGPLRSSYNELIKNKEVSHIHIMNQMDKEQLKEYYLVADLFILPTLHESWGLVVLEAMACGLPVITTKTCVAGLELIEEGINGYLFDPLDHETLETDIEKFISNPDLLIQMQANNLKKITYQTFENMLSVHMKIFNQYLEKKK